MKRGFGLLLHYFLLPGSILGIFVIPGFITQVSAQTAGNCQLAAVRYTGEVSAYQCSARLSEADALKYLSTQPDIRLVAPLRQYHITALPNDTYYAEQRPYLEQIRAHEAWDNPKLSASSQRPVIAILDTGVDLLHPDLAPNIWFNPWEVPNDKIDNDQNGYVDDQYGWDFVQNAPGGGPKLEAGWTQVAAQHGTIVAGVAAAVGNNAQGVAGVAWRARIMSVRVLDSKGVGDTVTVAQGIDYAIRNRADIINLSFVGPLSDPVLEDAMRRAYDAGILVVAAAGNEAAVGVNMNQFPQYPVCDDGPNGENYVIGVAAVDVTGKLADFSNFGSRCIDVSAPGVRIFSTQFTDVSQTTLQAAYGGYWNGTSVAAPMVSGALALLRTAYPTLSPSQLRDVLLASGDSIDSQNALNVRGQLGRRLNVRAALDLGSSVKFPQKSPVVVAPASGAPAEVSLYDVSGELIQKFLAYDPKFTRGINVAAGDVDGDGQVEIVTVPRAGGGPHVKVFNQQGQLESQFMALPESFRGGLSLAIGDITGDGQADIVLGVGSGGANLVGVFSPEGHRLHQFVPYETSYTGGVNVAVGDLDDDGFNDVVVTPMGASRLPLRVYDRSGILRTEFAAYPFTFRGGVNVAIGDVSGDGLGDIIVGAGTGGGPQVRVFNRDGRLLQQFFAYDSKFRGGVNVAVGDVDGDGSQDIAATPGTGGGPHIRVFNQRGQVSSQFFAQPMSFRGGLSVGSFR